VAKNVFSIHNNLTLQTARIKAVANDINNGHINISQRNNKNVKTINNYADQEEKLMKLLNLYIKLVEKDTKDINDMVKKVMLADSKLGNKFKYATKGASAGINAGVNKQTK